MGLTSWLAARAVGGAHALVVEVPGSWRTRVAVEQALAARGWRAALSPADADVLVVCGEPGERLAAAVDRVWEQLPGPRARVAVGGPAGARAALDEAAAALLDDRSQRADARARRSGPAATDAHGDSGGTDHGGTDHGGTDDGGTDDGGTDDGGMDHGDMDHGDMAPAGIPLAGGDEDRDGLEMDVLHVPLGPVLPYWPAGLVLHCTIAGDVVTAADAEVLPAAGRALRAAEPADTRGARAARRCDAAARLLALAGWDDAAAAAVRTRDALLADPAAGGPGLDRLRRRVHGSRSLRWLLRGLAAVDDARLAEHGLPAMARGDVHDRLLALLDAAAAYPDGAPVADPWPTRAAVGVLPDLVCGLDLAAVRLVVASLDPDTAAATAADREPARA